MSQVYEEAKKTYAAFSVDTEKALSVLSTIPISIHCWQGDDVGGFEPAQSALSGGIQATGNYPGKARNFTELTADYDKALSLIPGKHRISLHASYAVTDHPVERDELLPEHFSAWVTYAKERDLGVDMNATFFSHPKAADGLTLSHPDEEIRQFWIRHAIASRRIAEHFGKELGTPSVCNIWIPDGYKDVPADRMSPRARLKDSLDQIFAEKLPHVIDCVEGKLFGIGLESYTVGSNDFYLAYAATHQNVYPLLDNGHFHPTECVSDKIPTYLNFFDQLPLHVTRPVRWDSDHVVRLDDELREIAKEIVRCSALDKVKIGLDYFDASINRIAAWVVGVRAMQKALLHALLIPYEQLRQYQNESRFTELMVYDEALKTGPAGAVWDEFCRRNQVPDDFHWYADVQKYENDVLRKR